ncbi:phosphatase PAP2 family protein [Streptomyces sp. SLBN-31]|uniref:phosphatase PAP2 family protein n=1 Tax=Streptomyces sp. SLBN-31 TaxID=2768444 RepID=UPI00114EA1FD|nr:phosphatase PAP2 family protein [Streptomyces sp. SLBN-31]TQJ88388.1 PAP2 superfamily protein [Streptomyces sp. SLBN-31]
MPKTETTPGIEAAAPRTRLRWWTELPLILLVYACYSAGRLVVRGDTAGAVDHGLAILRIEKFLHLNAEHPLNRLFTREAWLGVPADFWYASLHYVVTPAILIWLFRSRAVHYRAARIWLMTSTFMGLIGFTLLPTCPPRLLSAGHGFVDTMAQYSSYGWWGGAASAPKGLGGMTNQYAAMPSLHVGWALWCGVMLWRYGRTRTTRAAAVAYPLLTTIVVMGTANHYFLDAVAGAAVMGVGLFLTPYVMGVADRLWGLLFFGSQHSGTSGSSIVSGGCQTSAGERYPRQHESLAGSGSRGEPGASPTDAGEGAAAAAR